jgi:hypothetical protein
LRQWLSRTARFHHDQTDHTVGEPTLELRAGEAVRFDYSPGAVGDGELKHRLREIHSHNRQSSGSIHVGLLLIER